MKTILFFAGMIVLCALYWQHADEERAQCLEIASTETCNEVAP